MSMSETTLSDIYKVTLFLLTSPIIPISWQMSFHFRRLICFFPNSALYVVNLPYIENLCLKSLTSIFL